MAKLSTTFASPTEQLEAILDRQILASATHGDVLEPFEDRPIAQVPKNIETYLANHVRLLRVERIVYEKKQEKIEELLNLFSSMYGTGCSLVFGAFGDGEKITLLLGVQRRDEALSGVTLGRKALEANLEGHLTGTQARRVDYAEARELLEGEPWQRAQAIASLTGIPSLKTEQGQEFVQGLDRYLDAMRRKRFGLLVLADPIDQARVATTRTGITDLHTALSGVAEEQLTLQESVTEQTTETLQRGITRSISHTVGKTQSSTTTVTEGTSRPPAGARKLAAGLAVGAGVAAFTPLSALAPVLGGAAFLTMQAAGQETRSTAEGKTTGTQQSDTEQESTQESKSYAEALSKGLTEGRTITIRDRAVKRTLDRLDEQLERLDQGARYGFWNTGVYFLAESTEDARVGIGVLQGLFRGEHSNLEPSHVNVWTRDADPKRFDRVRDNLRHLCHPRIDARSLLSPDVAESTGIAHFTPTSMLASDELALVMGLPEKSVPGVTVLHAAAFGRQVTRQRPPEDARSIELGRVYHMGTAEDALFSLDRPSLAMHGFVSGTTGSGKTNVTLGLLEQLSDRSDPLPFLVIEPAKREYTALLSLSREDYPVRYFSAGLPGTEVLRLNPFQFPADVHVYEHLDRLVQVFNAAFPMYAAMPALLEEGMRRSYESSGWNLSASRCRHDPPRYPTLVDLADHLRGVVETSDYSAQLKADYQGALVTRIRSLTRGVRGEMLCPLPGEVTPDAELFDSSCVVNLMSLGSPETKALVMGLLLTRLHEYRQCAMGEPEYAERVARDKLLHLTVLEEAHHLLKRHSTEVAQESANLRGMAVEMFATAIAEMRALGEGFLVVDQSATSLDLSVIKNTNTKIILRTPFEEDRVLVGESMNANPEQIDELGRLETGVGAVYQNDWLEPVLCHFELCPLTAPGARTQATPSPRLSRNQYALLVGLATHDPVAEPRAIADQLLEGTGFDLEGALGELTTALGQAHLLPSFRALYSPESEDAQAALTSALCAGAASAADQKYLLLGELVRRFGLPLTPLIRALKSFDPDDPSATEEMRVYFA
jgi:hypothetical protein